MTDYIEAVRSVYKEILEHRRAIHSNPELSFREFKTSEYIQKKLNEMDIPFRIMAGTGVVGLIGSGDKCVALRADMDALPILEETELPFCSQNDGIMHACGHDMHISMLLGAAKVLKGMEKELPGIVKLIFQPGEEKIPGGASILIDEGVLENPAPSAIFGQHVNPEIQTGKIALASGPVMASADEVYFTVKGKSSHAAQPQNGSDAVLAASYLVLFLNSITGKFKDPFTPGVLSITSIRGGSATNIFPDSVELMGTLRSFDIGWREQVHDILENRTVELCSAYNTECIVRIEKGYLPVINDTKTTEFARKAAEEILGVDNTLEFGPKMWAEDFSHYSHKIPGTFWFLGVRPKELSEMPALHNSKFNPEEEAMIYGAAMFIKVAKEYLEA